MYSGSFPQRFSKPLRLACFVILIVCLSFLVSTPAAFAAIQSPARHASAQIARQADWPPRVGPFLQTATTSNTFGSSTYINNSLTNGNSNLALQVEANWNPGAVSTGFDNHLVGVWYDVLRGAWAIFNEDGSAMPVGAQFNYTIGNESQTADANSVSGDEMVIDPGLTGTGYSNDLILVTPSASPNGLSDTHALGVVYDSLTGLWSVYHEDQTPIQIGETFNILVELKPLPPDIITVTANTSGYACTPPYENSGALFLATHVFTTASQAYITGVTGVLFTGTQWCVFEYRQLIPTGTQFFLDDASAVRRN